MSPLGSDADIQFRYPYPLAASFRATRTRHEPLERLGSIFQATEALFRFLALVNLCDLLAKGLLTLESRALLDRVRRPSMGTWLALLRDTTRLLAEDEPFLAPLPELLLARRGESPLMVEFGRMVQARNRTVHGDGVISGGRARSEVEELLPKLRDAYGALRFLLHLRLGYPAAGRRRRKTYQYFWYPLTGLTEFGEYMILRGKRLPPERLLYLIDDRGRSLCLWPFFRWGLGGEQGQDHFLMLADAPRGLRSKTLRYSHPVLRASLETPVQDPEDPAVDGLGLAEAIGRAAEMELSFDLELEPASLHSLQPSAEPEAELFDERYEVVGVLGRGGMGEVYRVFDTELKVFRALKRLRKDLLMSLREVERFRREGQMLARFDEPGIVRIFDIDVDHESGAPYIVMEEVAGLSLQERLDQNGPLEMEAAAEMTAACLDVLDRAHRAGVIHRDLKPSNVMLRENGSICLLDFGIALDAERLTRLTRSFGHIGSQGFVAPEQGDGHPVFASDQFSAARFLICLATGSIDEEAIGSWSLAFRQVVERALQKSPADRFDSAAAMAAALRGAISGAAIDRPRPSEGAAIAAVRHGDFLESQLGRHCGAWRLDSFENELMGGGLFRATGRERGREALVTLFYPDQAVSEPARERFSIRASAIWEQRPERLAKLRDHGVSWGLYHAFKPASGQAISELIERAGRLEPTAACEIALSLLEALAELRERGLVHGELRPEALLRQKDGRVVFRYLGLAEAGASVPEEAAPYIAPEVLAGDRPDFAADCYSFGAILYHLFTGHPPRREESTGESAKGPFEFSLTLFVIRRLMSKSLRDRLVDLTEIRAALESLSRQDTQDRAAAISRGAQLEARRADLDAAIDAKQHQRFRDWQLGALRQTCHLGAYYEAVSDAGEAAWVKLVLPECFAPGVALARFRQELAVLGRLDVPGVARMIESGLEPRPYLVIAMSQTRSLSELLEESGRFDPIRAVELACAILDVLGAIHDRGIIHRAICDKTVHVDESDRPCLIDFVLGRDLRAEGERITGTDEVMGLPKYIAPEAWESSSRDSAYGTDLYALGILLFRILTGQHAFQGQSFTQLRRAHLKLPVPEIRELRPELPSFLSSIVRDLLAKRLEDRYQSAGEAKRDLEELLEQMRA